MSHILHKLEEQTKGWVERRLWGAGVELLSLCSHTVQQQQRSAPQTMQSHNATEGLGCRQEEASQQQLMC